MVAFAVILTALPASAGITWEDPSTRTLERPRTWNTSVASDQISGSHYGLTNTVAVSQDGTRDYPLNARVLSLLTTLYRSTGRADDAATLAAH